MNSVLSESLGISEMLSQQNKDKYGLFESLVSDNVNFITEGNVTTVTATDVSSDMKSYTNLLEQFQSDIGDGLVKTLKEYRKSFGTDVSISFISEDYARPIAEKVSVITDDLGLISEMMSNRYLMVESSEMISENKKEKLKITYSI